MTPTELTPTELGSTELRSRDPRVPDLRSPGQRCPDARREAGPQTAPRRRRWLQRSVAAALALAVLSLQGTVPAAASSSFSALTLNSALLAGPVESVSQSLRTPAEDSGGLKQDVRENEPTANQKVLFTKGHVDIGPRWVGEKWTLDLRDDSGKSPVWRRFDDTVFTVTDETLMQVPEDSRYDFLGEKPGTPVYVLPQTEKQGIPWPGWNTQHPSALKVMGKGTHFTLDRVSGPGNLIMYLENGALDAPQVLWDSRKSERQSIFAGANTHTHANWVFTKPGVYYLQVTASAKASSGEVLTSTQVMRFAVGSTTDPAPGFASDPFAGVGEPSAGSADSRAGSEASWVEGLVRHPAAPWLLSGAAVALMAGGTVTALRRRKTLAQALSGAQPDQGQPDQAQRTEMKDQK